MEDQEKPLKPGSEEQQSTNPTDWLDFLTENSTTVEQTVEEIVKDDSQYALFNPAPEEPQLEKMERVLAPERRSLTYQFRVDEYDIYVTVGMFDDGTPAELLINVPKADYGTIIALQTFARTVSIGLQQNVSLSFYTQEFIGAAKTDDADVLAIIDVCFRWLSARFEGTKTGSIDSLRRSIAVDSADS